MAAHEYRQRVVSRHFTKQAADDRATRIRLAAFEGRGSGWATLQVRVKRTGRFWRAWAVIER